MASHSASLPGSRIPANGGGSYPVPAPRELPSPYPTTLCHASANVTMMNSWMIGALVPGRTAIVMSLIANIGDVVWGKAEGAGMQQ